MVHGPLHPSLWTRDSQVVLDRKAPMTSALAMLGSSLHYREKHRIYHEGFPWISINNF